MLQPLISVIVPCYNVMEYLPKCVESILSQTYKNLEIILVDDGSTDSSGKICDGYAAKDNRIKVIHKKNGGLSDARNVALDVMKGEYVTCHQTFEEGTEPEVCNESVVEDVSDMENVLTGMFYQRMFDTTAWAKMYHRSLFANDIRYPKGWLYEDLPTTYCLMMKCDRIAFSSYRSYFYLLRSTSIEGAPFKPQKYESCIKIIRQLEADKVTMSERVKQALDCRIVSFAFHILLEIPQEEKEMRCSLWDIIRRKRICVMFDGKARKKARGACLLSFGGMWLVNLFASYGKSRK